MTRFYRWSLWLLARRALLCMCGALGVWQRQRQSWSSPGVRVIAGHGRSASRWRAGTQPGNKAATRWCQSMPPPAPPLAVRVDLPRPLESIRSACTFLNCFKSTRLKCTFCSVAPDLIFSIRTPRSRMKWRRTVIQYNVTLLLKDAGCLRQDTDRVLLAKARQLRRTPSYSSVLRSTH